MKIIIEAKEGKASVSCSDATFPEILAAFASITQSMLKTILERAKGNEDIDELKKELYDMVNITYSTVLIETFPDIEMRPELTVQALLEAENAILEKPVNPTDAD